MIQLTHVTKSYTNDRPPIVNDVSLMIEKGETLVILGSSGAGKSTVLKMINRLIEPTFGTIEIQGRNIMDYDAVTLRRSMGYVFQGIGLFPHLTVAENIAIVLRLTKHSAKACQQKAYELLELINLDPAIFAERYPAELSGGQRQRIGVARALASNPGWLLMDEPFGALDAVSRHDLQEEVLRLKKQLKKTIVFVTHDIFEALRLGDRLAVMHDGKIEQIGSKEQLIHQPQTDFVRDLFQKTAHQTQLYSGYFQ